MSEEQKTAEPTKRAMKAAVAMEVHAACSTTTKAKAVAIDNRFPGYDAMLQTMQTIAGMSIDYDVRALVEDALTKAEGRS